ncbi:MAG TPA: R3H domain-containing nucleic acid-binding protein, partial [Candidatus Cloacimonas sp.]|nr:R3H domain-containing nucleic acid-binding protein [Candidatus Cloacimonas sp.]
TLDPMTAAERRLIHRHVERDKALRTLTIGEGEMKRIVVFSAKQNEKEALSQSKSATQEEKASPREKREERPPRPPRSPRPQNKEEQSETRPTRNPRPARPENQDAKAEIREARPPRQGRPRFDRNRRRPNKSANDGNE